MMDWQNKIIKNILLVWLLCFCSCINVPDKSYYRNVPLSKITNPYIIEVNDNGEFHNKNQITHLISGLKNEKENTHIVLFIHGWHHNSHPNDPHLIDFKKFLSNLGKKGKNHNTIGIYLGWRGEEKTGINYLTLKSRKNISNIVGSKALNKVLSILKTIVKDKNNFRVTIIGHSLGGSVLFYSIFDEIKNGIFDFSKQFKFIMLNPALSASEFDKGIQGVIHKRLDLRTEFPVIVMQSNTDFPVKWLLPFLTDSPSVGFSKKHITHGLWACAEDNATCIDNLKAKYEKKTQCVKLIKNKTWYLHTNNHTNEYNEYSCKESWELPFIVIQNAPTVSMNHNQILTNSFAEALLDIIDEQQK